MERPRRWNLVAIILYFVFHNKALCQFQKTSDTIIENRDFTKLSGFPSSTDQYTPILTTATGNGILPDLIPKLQGQSKVENLLRNPCPQDILPKPFSALPMPSGVNAQDPIVYSSQPFRQPASNQNILFATPSGLGCASNTMSSIPQPILPTCIPQSQFNEINSYFYNQIAEPVTMPDLCSNLNLPILPPGQPLPSYNGCSGLLADITSNLEMPCVPQSVVFTNDYPQTPLQINLPPTSLPAPKISVISVSPSNCPVPLPLPCCPDYSTNLAPFQYPPQSPIVIQRSKSSWKKWLPLLLLTLLNDGGCNNRGGCSCCCCSCNGGGNKIPVPYPIPISVNNPVINTDSSCRYRENDDWFEEEDRKRK